jgi:hypothetical protein
MRGEYGSEEGRGREEISCIKPFFFYYKGSGGVRDVESV